MPPEKGTTRLEEGLPNILLVLGSSVYCCCVVVAAVVLLVGVYVALSLPSCFSVYVEDNKKSQIVGTGIEWR